MGGVLPLTHRPLSPLLLEPEGGVTVGGLFYIYPYPILGGEGKGVLPYTPGGGLSGGGVSFHPEFPRARHPPSTAYGEGMGYWNGGGELPFFPLFQAY